MQKLILFTVLVLQFSSYAWAQEKEEEAEEVAKTDIAYVSLGDALVLNLRSSRNRLTFLQISADILIRDDNAEEIITTHIPAIRHSLIVLLSEQYADDIKSPDKREKIRQQATMQVKELIASLSGNEDVSEVLFSSILVQ